MEFEAQQGLIYVIWKRFEPATYDLKEGFLFRVSQLFFLFFCLFWVQYKLKNLEASENWTRIVGAEIQSADH